jgi:hypothetical protein
MSGERPVPLWPEGLRKERKLPPVENQQPKALTEGAAVPVAKQLELSKPGEQPAQQPGGASPEANEENLNSPSTEQAKPLRRRRAGSFCRGV